MLEDGNHVCNNLPYRCRPSPPRVEGEFVETLSPYTPLGSNGVGESGAIAVPAAIANAVADALAPLDVRHVDPPYTPERLWRVLRER